MSVRILSWATVCRTRAPHESKFNDFRVEASSHAGLTLRNNAPTFSVTFIFVGRLVGSLASLSLGLGNSAYPFHILPSSGPPLSPSCLCFSRRSFSFFPTWFTILLLVSLSGPSYRFRSVPAILERVSYQPAAARMVPLRSLENIDTRIFATTFFFSFFFLLSAKFHFFFFFF